MSVALQIRRDAERDIADAAEWYEKQKSGLGHEFLDELLRALRQVAERPDMYPVVHRQTRRALIRRFPFGLYFRVEPECIVVIAVLHGSRDPQRWKQRP